MDDSKIFIVGANGQLGTALKIQYPKARFADIAELDITDKESVANFDWSGTEIIINAAAYTNVDSAETTDGRIAAWKVNAGAVANLVAVAAQKNAVLVHISTDYVFDGGKAPHSEDEPFSPLSVYGASKAAGDIAASLAPKHYILRTSWVIGDGKNFVRTMLELGKKGINPTVVADQTGRLTFTSELVRAIDHLLTSEAEGGVYNVTNDGPVASWADITRKIFELSNLSSTVTDTTTAEYYAGKMGIAPRPLLSELDLSKLQSTGFESHDWQDDLAEYVKKELQ
jgi:dTDP-4-dehydrorhamnose 3,5-epimerase